MANKILIFNTINKVNMKAEKNGILKYAKRKKKLQSGGVTFFEQPTMYNPEEDFYMKTAYARYNASQKAAKKKNTENTPDLKAKYLTTGPKGTRDHYNNIISKAMANYREQVAANSPGWATSSAGLAAADEAKRIIAEATARNSTIEKDRKNFIKDLSDNDLTTTAFFGGYFVKDKQTNVVDTISTEDYLADPSRYQTFTVDEMLRYADSKPQDSSRIYQKINSISAGNKFIKENIKSEKAVAEGKALTSNELNSIYQGILAGAVPQQGIDAGVDQVVANQFNSIMSNEAAKNNIYRRVYENPTYVANIVAAESQEDKRMAEINAARAETFRLIYMHGTPTYKSGESGETGGGLMGGKNYKIGDELALESTGYGMDKGKTLSTTDLPSHFKDGDEEVMNFYKASRVPATKKEIAKINQKAILSTKDNVSANLTSVQAFSDLNYIDFDKIYDIGGNNISGENGIFKNTAEAKNNLVFTDNDMARISMPVWTDGSPITGMGTFLKEFEEKVREYETPNSSSKLGSITQKQHEDYKEKALLEIKNNGSDEAKIVAEYLLYYSGGNVPTSNKLASEVYAYVKEDQLANYPVYTEVDDDGEIEKYFKMNPQVEKDGLTTWNKSILVKIPVYLDFLPATDIVNKMDASINQAARDDMVAKSAQQVPLSTLLEQIAPYNP